MKVRAYVDKDMPIMAWQEWRILNPFRYLRRHGIDVDTLYLECGQLPDPDTDIFIIPKMSVKEEDWERTGDWFDKIKSQGTKLVYEVDDDIFSEHYVSNISKMVWKQGNTADHLVHIIGVLAQKAKESLWTMLQCDAVITSTKPLGTYIRSITDLPVFIVENAIDRKKFEIGLRERSVDPNMVLVGWAGGSRNFEDLDAMIEAWTILAAKYPASKVNFVVAGHTPPIILENDRLAGRVTGLPWESTDAYAKNMQFDIGCASVSNSPFSLRKSPIKALEYGLAYTPIVASRNLYDAEPIILLAHDVESWVYILSYMIEHKDFRMIQADLYKTHVACHHDLRYEYIHWLKTYEDILHDNKEMVLSYPRSSNDIFIDKSGV